jgi:HEAT repeat protein
MVWRSALVAALFVAAGVALSFMTLKRGYYIGSTKFSVGTQRVPAGSALASEGFWVRNGWDGPTGEFTSGEMYGLNLPGVLLRLDITQDPIGAIKRNLPQDADGLVLVVAEGDSLVQQVAGKALIAKGADAAGAIPRLLALCSDSDHRDWIVLEVATAAKSNAVPALVEGLRRPQARVQRLAAEALGELGTNALAAVPELTNTLRSNDPEVLVMAALALRKIERRDHGEVALLIGLLGHQNTQVVVSACVVLGEFGPDAATATEPLIRVVEGGNPTTTPWAVRSLGMIGEPASSAIPILLRTLESTNPETLAFTMEALGKFGPKARDAIPRLVELAEEEDRMWGAISALSEMGTEAVPGLVEIYRKGRHGGAFWAARAFAKMGTNAAPAVPVLMESLEEPISSRAVTAAWALGSIGTPARSAVPRMLELLDDEDPRVRVRMAEAVWKLARQTNVVRAVMVRELAEWSKSPNALTSETEDMNTQTRQQIAAEVLGEMGPAAREALPLLSLLRRSSFENQREAAARAVRQIQQQ